MRGLICIFSILVVPLSLNLRAQSSGRSHAEPLVSSSCSNAHGWIRISTPGIFGALSCFSPQRRDGYASITAGGVNGRDDISIQMNILSRAGTHTCHVPTVEIDFHDGTTLWTTFRVRNGQFGDCTITQTYENGHDIWKGHVIAHLVIVRGNTTNGSPSRLHSEKDSSGNPVTRAVDVDWVFDKLFTPNATFYPTKKSK